MIAQRARDNLARVAFCALVGGQDELVFDGHSFVFDHDGRGDRPRAAVRRGAARLRRRPAGRRCGAPARHAPARRRRARPAATSPSSGSFATAGGATARATASAASVADAARAPTPRSTRRSCSARATTSRKNGFEHVVLGLSGGIDSTLVALRRRRRARRRPRHRGGRCRRRTPRRARRATRARSPPTSAIECLELVDRDADGASTTQLLADVFAGREPDITEENLQARIRGNLLMALSNKFGWLVLTTGNKSEMSVGYSTLYGDIAGGFAVIKDVPKLLVYRLVAMRASARDGELGPARRSSTRAPSAELRPDQTRRRLAAALRDPRRDPRGLRRGGPRPRPARRARAAGGRRRARDPPGRPRRVQAPPEPARDQGHHAGLRPRPPRADHQPLPRLTRAGSGERRERRQRDARRQRRTAIVIRTTAQSRSSSSRHSTSQTQLVRPRWMRRATTWIVPSVIGRRNDVWFDWPEAVRPSA